VRFARRATVPLLALILAASCSSDSQVIARVGNRDIRADDMVATARVLAARGALPPDSTKVRLLNALIQRELLVIAAQQMGFHRDTAFLDQRVKIEHDLLRDRMINELVPGPIEVSEAEVEQLYRWRDQETRARVIFTPSQEAALAAMTQLKGGIDFALVANRFNPPGFAPPGGDIGFVPPGFLQPPLDDLVRTGVPGRLYGPIDAPPQGWFVVRIEERRPRQGQPLEVERPMLTEVIRQRKQMISVVRSVDRLKTAYQLRVLPGAPQELITRALKSVSDSTGQLPPITLGERATPLAEFRGGSYTLGEAYQELQAGAVNRPNFQSLANVEHWIESRAIDRLLVQEATTRRYADDPSLQRAVREQLNDHLIESFYNQEVIVPVQANEEQAAAFYARQPQAGATLQRVDVLTATLSDSAAAAQLLISASRSPGLREAATAAGIGAEVHSETIDYPSPNPIWMALQSYFSGTEPGGYLGPFNLGTGWLVLQVVSKSQSTPPWGTLPENTKQSLRAQATDELRLARLHAITDSLRQQLHVTVYTKRLERLTLPQNNGSFGALTGQ
jgi:hypothetical protein